MHLPETSAVYKASEAKLRQAFENLHTLGTKADEFRETGPHRLAVEFEPGSGWWIAKTGVVKEPPPDLGVLVGAIGYQCLSAFNLLVWELAARKVGRRKVHAKGVKNHVQLPIALNPQAFADNPLVTRQLVSKAALAVIEGLQPYNEPHGPRGPNEHPLPMVKEVADSDKHRVLTGSLVQADLRGIAFKWDAQAASGPTQEVLISPGDTINPDTPILRIRFATGNEKADVKVHREPEAMGIVFETDTWRINLEDLRNISVWAFDRLMRFTPLFPAR